MDTSELLALLLGVAVLLPLASFAVVFTVGRWMGHHGEGAAYVAAGAIVGAFVLSLVALFGVWLPKHWPMAEARSHAEGQHAASDAIGSPPLAHHAPTYQVLHPGHGPEDDVAAGNAKDGHNKDAHGPKGKNDHAAAPPSYAGDYYVIGNFGRLKITIGYYIDALTLCMFCMVGLIASCIHFYAMGYMHDELHDVTDHEVTLSDGEHLQRPGRFHRFFQYMSLFCFSMLGLVLSGNIAMVFVFWELVGICSYFLIGFYVERQSASTAANKAFIVNRVGDFGMIVGLAALWTGLGTFAFGDTPIHNERGEAVGVERGIFSLVRPEENHHALQTPDGMVHLAARDEIASVVRDHAGSAGGLEAARSEVAFRTAGWREQQYGYWLLIIAGAGIFCGCVGKSAQFPLHTWLPDAMEGPTPVSALVHSATMVAAGVYLVARFYPVFAPEVLFVIALVGFVTLFLAATIAITATDIKRVLAYSTVSQLGYMMLALGLGGWLAGVLHLFTHAFFKSLLFLGSGSVIHAVHTNDLTKMGGLLKKMPVTGYTMLVGCLAIAGAGIPLIGLGFSGYYSKDAILEQSYSFLLTNRLGTFWPHLFFWGAVGGAAITAFYMFRLWYLAFVGKPRDEHSYEHAVESPPVMYVPLIVLAVFAVSAAWSPPSWSPIQYPTLSGMLEQARPVGTLADVTGPLIALTWPNEHDAHAPHIAGLIPWMALAAALAGFALATVFYGLKYLDADDARRQFAPVHRFLLNKWWFDELYDFLFVRPTFIVSRLTAGVDRRLIDGFIDGLARGVRAFSGSWDYLIDRLCVDGSVNLVASWLHSLGLALREVQTGRVRQYVLFIVVGTVAIFVMISFFWAISFAQ
jgi:NADH:ubiquinone oxidoreductase subunit 5 (subunit L)/multisubunit Na+/H+ antiporter MnhA subunit